ncbi:MAG TPA: Lrp/AsnC family transcriptional regulator [Nitrolancea sp.]|jgi:Lrp/AsnC family transcriptional regulator for asnA, asnC and gidA|nr:Lrp/AsnC family transcriptional regulator [Nitrolancea sp.]
MSSVMVLDELDHTLIELLQADARMSYQDLADSTTLSASTVRRRVERLVSGGLIRFVAVPSWSRLGLGLTAFIGISVDLDRLRDIGNQFAEMDEIVFVAVTTGSYDLIAEAVLPTNEDFVRFVTVRIAPIKGIRRIQTFMIPEFIKSFEQYRYPKRSTHLYKRNEDGTYAYDVEEFITDSERRVLFPAT